MLKEASRKNVSNAKQNFKEYRNSSFVKSSKPQQLNKGNNV